MKQHVAFLACTGDSILPSCHTRYRATTSAGGGPSRRESDTERASSSASIWPILTHHRYVASISSQARNSPRILDFHPDSYYKPFTSTDSESVCHRSSGPAGIYGAETTDCDSPFSLVNATFQWINDNLKDSIDFVIWTGDSARHDSDETIPRSEKEVISLNEMLVAKFTEVFGKEDDINDTDPTNDYTIPIIPTYGNNDIMPHNIMAPGPNKWTKSFSHVWRSFIPEEQRHAFERGGWFFVEVIPHKLAVFSLNTLYFFDSNTAVDGCAKKSEPGYQHLQWLRIQLQFLRERGMKAILTGHVPPARTENKQSWDETCWQKYSLWMRQYRDVIVGSVYGHMNIDHFMLQDFRGINKKTTKGRISRVEEVKESSEDELSVQSLAEYLSDLRAEWARIPDEPESTNESDKSKKFFGLFPGLSKKKHKSKEQKYLEKIGGEWAERYSVSLITASVVPNYFPTFRVIEYNLTGLDKSLGVTHTKSPRNEEQDLTLESDGTETASSKKHKKKGKKKKKKHHKKPFFTVPLPPSKSSPPGPAYSPQLFTWTSYTQYFANLTRINNDFHSPLTVPPSLIQPISSSNDGLQSVDDNDENETQKAKKTKWREGKYKNRHPKHDHSTETFTYEIEYDTQNDTIFAMPDLTVRNWVNLARTMGKYRPSWSTADAEDEVDCSDPDADADDSDSCGDTDVDAESKRKSEKKRKRERRKVVENVWFTFLRRAFVGAKDEEELRNEACG